MKADERWRGHPRSVVAALLARSVSDRRAVSARVKIAERVESFIDINMANAVYARLWDGDAIVHGEANGRYAVELAP